MEGSILAVATEGDTTVPDRVDHWIPILKVDALITPMITVIPLQLFAYHVAVLRGCDVDKPRNLAKRSEFTKYIST